MNLLTDNIHHIFRRYMFSAFGSAIITSIYSMVDIICVGQYGGPDGAASLACITPMWSIFMSIGMLFGIGGAVRMSLCRGEGQPADGDQYFTAAVSTALLVSILLTTGSLICHESILRLFGADDSLIGGAMSYSRWIFPVIPFFLMAQVLSAFIRNDGAPMLCTAGILAGGILNIILDIFLVFGLDLGLAGAGIATAIGQTVSVLILCSYFFQKRCRLRLVKPIRFLRSMWESILAGFAPFLVDISYGVTVALFNNQIMYYGSSVELAVYSTVSNVAIMFQSLFYGIGQALQPIVSVNFGAKRGDRVQAVFRLALRAAVIMSILFCLISELIPGLLLRLYMDVSDAVMAVGPSVVRTYSISFLLMGINVVASYYLQSVLKNGQSVLISVSRGFLFCSLFLFALPSLFGLNAIWWTMPLTELCTFLLAWVLLRRSAQQTQQ